MKKLFSLLMTIVGFQISSYAQKVAIQDSLALVALYNATDGPNWGTNTNWLQPGKSVTEWYGIGTTKDEGHPAPYRVNDIALINSHLKGQLPEQIGDLEGLYNFSIGFSELSGPIPASVVKWKLSQLILIYECGLSGEIPAYLFQIPDSVANGTRQVAVTNNNFTSIDFRPLPGYPLRSFHINGNRLDFADIEPLIPAVAQLPMPAGGVFLYAPQQPIYTTAELNLHAGAKLTLKTETGGTVNHYQWYKNNTPITNATQTTLNATLAQSNDGDVYTAKITNDIATALTLERNPVTVHVTNTAYIDCTATSMQISAGTNDPQAKFLWSTGATTRTITATASGKYGVRIEGDGYIAEDTLDVALLGTLTLGSDINSCQPTVELKSNIPNADVYIWQTPTGEIQGPASITASVNGQYSLTVKKSVCENTDDVNVIVGNVTPGTFNIQAGTAIVNDGEVALAGVPLSFTNTTGAGTGYAWSFGDLGTAQGDEATHRYAKAGDYTITLIGTDSRNCPVTAEKHITIRDIMITTAITPNNNGKNDKWYVEPFIYNAALKVVDRKGKTVYEADPYNDDFDGNGLNEGIYYYELYLKEINKRYKGYVHIIKK